VGLINNLQQAFEEPQVIARNMLVDMKHPLKEKLTVIGSPIKLSRTPVEYKKAPPMLGEHTDEILSGILDAEKIAELRQRGIIG
jgi:crotonobetainyl-CoA:carnitine CoA-transferase CaiB-like acyl-CoA transferase